MFWSHQSFLDWHFALRWPWTEKNSFAILLLSLHPFLKCSIRLSLSLFLYSFKKWIRLFKLYLFLCEKCIHSRSPIGLSFCLSVCVSVCAIKCIEFCAKWKKRPAAHAFLERRILCVSVCVCTPLPVWPDEGIKSWQISFKNCPKVATYFLRNSDIFKKSPKGSNIFGLLGWDNLLPKMVKTRPIWSHWPLLTHTRVSGAQNILLNFNH